MEKEGFRALMRLGGETVCEHLSAQDLLNLRVGSIRLRALVAIEARRRYNASSIAPPAALLPQALREWLAEHGGAEQSSLRTLSLTPPDWVMLTVVRLLELPAAKLVTSALPNTFFARIGEAEGPRVLSFQLGPLMLATIEECAQLTEVARMHVIDSVVDFGLTAREMRADKQYETPLLDNIGPLTLTSKAFVRALQFSDGTSGDGARISMYAPCWSQLDALASHEVKAPTALWAHPPFCTLPPDDLLLDAPARRKSTRPSEPRDAASEADEIAAALAAAESSAVDNECEAALYALTRLARAMRRTLVCARAAQALRNAGAACYAARDLEGAAAHYAHAISLRPDDTTLHSNRALCLLGLGAMRCAAYEALYAVELGAANSKGARHLAAALVACGHSIVPPPDFVAKALTQLAATEPGAGAREQLLGLVEQLRDVRESTLADVQDALAVADAILAEPVADGDAVARRRRLAALLDRPYLLTDVIELHDIGMSLQEGYPRCELPHAAHAACERVRAALVPFESALARALIETVQPPLQHRFLGAIAHTRGVEGELLALLRRCRLVTWEREMTIEIAAVDAGERAIQLVTSLDKAATSAERARVLETAEMLLSLACSLSFLLWLSAVGDAGREEPADLRTRLGEQLISRMQSARMRLGGEARWQADDTAQPAFNALMLMRPSLRLQRRMMAMINGTFEQDETLAVRWPALV